MSVEVGLFLFICTFSYFGRGRGFMGESDPVTSQCLGCML